MVRGLRGLLLASVASLGCGDEGVEAESPTQPLPCLPPNRVVGERCLEPGVQDDGCPAGTLALENGSCRPAGIPPELCADGFVHDGDAGCEPILPAEPCPAGELAVPGERACHAVMPCGAGAWGDIPIDGTSVYVDAGYPGADSDGSMAKPWTSISNAVAAAPPGALIAIAAGSYAEDVVIAKPLRLWGICPERATLLGTDAVSAALIFEPEASGSEVHGIAVSDGAFGIHVVGAPGVVLDQIWVHDSPGRGIHVAGGAGPTGFTLRRSLIEHTIGFGISAIGGVLTIEDVVVRNTLPEANSFGRGLSFSHEGGSSAVLVRRSVIEKQYEFGIFVAMQEAELEGVVARDTLPDVGTGVFGRGIQLQCSTGDTCTSTVRSSLAERNHEVGLFVSGTDAAIEGVVARQTIASPNAGGWGLGVQSSMVTGLPARVRVQDSLFDQNRQAGLLIVGSEATIEGVVVRGTEPSTGVVTGSGIGIQYSPSTGLRASAVVRGSVIEENTATGFFVSGSDATVDGLLVRHTQSKPSAPFFGRGVNFQFYPDVPTAVSMRCSVIENNPEAGFVIMGADATIDAVLVRATTPSAQDDLFGDGMSFVSLLDIPTSGRVTNSRVDRNARAGIANFGARVAIGTSSVACNVIDLVGEASAGLPFVYEDLGGTTCGCEPLGSCAARSVGLSPPEQVPTP